MIPFTKMHGLGNDFVVLSELDGRFDSRLMDAATALRLCDRRFGIGADQILVIGLPRKGNGPDARPDVRMDIWNADGSTAEMCGNGIRAVALHLHDHAPENLRGRHSYRIETGAGVLEVFIEGREVRVNMGAPRLLADRQEGLETPHGKFEFWEVSMGNPHAVFFVPPGGDVDAIDLTRLGPAIECHPRFPERTNVEFVQVLSPNRIGVRVWERGAGITLACGTGACASAVASLHSGRAKSPLEVELPGGRLRIAWDGNASDPVWMSGPAVEVFRGMFELRELSDPSG